MLPAVAVFMESQIFTLVVTFNDFEEQPDVMTRVCLCVYFRISFCDGHD